MLILFGQEKAEWGEHEQLLRSEKDALSTSVTHLQHQLDERTKEHQFHLQRLKSEAEGLLKDKNTLIGQLVSALSQLTERFLHFAY